MKKFEKSLLTQENRRGGCYLNYNRKEPRRRIKIILVGVIATLLILVGTSYAWWTSTASQQGINKVQSSCIKITLQNETGNIKLQNAYPLSDDQAKELIPYTFTIKNTCNTIVDYTVKLEKLMENSSQESNLLKSDYIAVVFNGGQKQLLSSYPTGNITYDGSDYISKEARELIKGTLEGNKCKNYQIKLWMDESVTATDDSMNKSFISKIVVDGSVNELAQYDEPILHGADPVLGNEESKDKIALLSTNTLAEVEPTTNDKLIPVVIDEQGKVTRANLAHDWYNYEEKRWANAVILNNETTEPEVGAEIPEDDIESYFVWIPKYKYQLFNTTNFSYSANGSVATPQEIKIDFGIDNTTNKEGECETPGKSGDTGECKDGDWMTHPAFLAFEGSKGLWVGKFETGYKGATSTNAAQQNENASDKVIIKPNVYSWRSINVSNAYQTSYGYQRNLESHMMKNTEWGAVAYLQNSAYGSQASVRINNNSAFLTGYAAVIEPTCGYTATNETCNKYETVNKGTGTSAQDGIYSLNYFNTTSTNASTTGNKSGIYDMSGGAWEYMMAVMKDENNKPVSGPNDSQNSGFKGSLTNQNSTVTDGVEFPTESKYYDTYSYTKNSSEYKTRILGDATSEMGPFKDVVYTPTNGKEAQTRHMNGWYDDETWLVFSSGPWGVRGGNCDVGLGAGVFTSARNHGKETSNMSFRIVLAV